MAEEDLAPGKSSVAVNNCIRQLSYCKNDIRDTVGIWGEVRVWCELSLHYPFPPLWIHSTHSIEIPLKIHTNMLVFHPVLNVVEQKLNILIFYVFFNGKKSKEAERDLDCCISSWCWQKGGKNLRANLIFVSGRLGEQVSQRPWSNCSVSTSYVRYAAWHVQ